MPDCPRSLIVYFLPFSLPCIVTLQLQHFVYLNPNKNTSRNILGYYKEKLYTFVLRLYYLSFNQFMGTMSYSEYLLLFSLQTFLCIQILWTKISLYDSKIIYWIYVSYLTLTFSKMQVILRWNLNSYFFLYGKFLWWQLNGNHYYTELQSFEFMIFWSLEFYFRKFYFIQISKKEKKCNKLRLLSYLLSLFIFSKL